LRRFLIVNADDFGLSDGVNRGIIEAHQQGIVTSVSVMVLQVAAKGAAAYVIRNSALDAGLHVDLGEWRYYNGSWEAIYETAPQDIGRDVEHQVELFRDLFGRNPSHMDSHQHVHLHEPARTVMLAVASDLGVPLRSLSAEVRYVGAFYGQDARGQPLPRAIEVGSLVQIIQELELGATELGCHPGFSDGLQSSYGRERDLELATLTSPQVITAITDNGIELGSFATLPFWRSKS